MGPEINRLLVELIFAAFGVPSNITAPSTYTIYGGDLPFKYSISGRILTNEELIHLVRIEDGLVLVSTPLLRNHSEAELAFYCGVLNTAGRFVFRLVDRPNGSMIAESGVVTVTWPRVTLHASTSTTILSDDVTMTSSIEAVPQCEPNAEERFGYDVQLVYRGPNVISGEHSRDLSLTEGEDEEKEEVIGTKRIRSISALVTESVVFPCSLIDRSGRYRTILKTAGVTSRDLVATSNVMDVGSEGVHSLSLPDNVAVVYPCSSHVTVHFRRPKCSGSDDKIRLYRLFYHHNRDANKSGKRLDDDDEYIALDKLRQEYVTERRAQVATFACSWFSSSDVGYCFRYAYVTRGNVSIENGVTCLASTSTSGRNITLPE